MRDVPLQFSSVGEAHEQAHHAALRPVTLPRPQHRPATAGRILLVTTGQLPSTARLAMELHDAGAQVGLLSPGNHPGRVLDGLADWMSYRAIAPRASLEAALRRMCPDLVIPCDERAIRDLHRLWRASGDATIRAVIERSVGPADAFAVVTSRDGLLSLARDAGARVPPSAPLPNRSALAAWTATHPGPYVLKADGSWAGFGVRIARDAAAAQEAFERMTQPMGLRLAVREALLEGDRFGLRDWLRRERPAMSVQGFIDGWPANIGVACWKGEILAATCAEAVATESATGPSTVARIINNPEMLDSARRVVRKLGLSGLVGFDFMIDAATGAAWLIEMNARTTPICPVRLGGGRDLAEALVASLVGRPVRNRPPRTDRDIVVFFPDTWRRDPANQFLRTGYHDVPWEQPELVRRLMLPEIRDRYWITRKLRRLWLLATAERGA